MSSAEVVRFSSCWVGEQLLPLANACINSFGARGFAYDLYTYEPVLDTPACVTSRDARDLAAAEEVFIAHGGFETFADLLAYRFLDRVGGWWVDNDVVCTHGDMPDAEIAFAEERPGILNNAVLRFPASHPAIIELLAFIKRIDPVHAPWGSTGPRALTTVLERHDLRMFLRPTPDFYPLHWREAGKFLFPEFLDEVKARTQRSPLVHLWGAVLREVGFDFRQWHPPPGSFLDELYTRHLDRHVLDRLHPVDVDRFRHHVTAYMMREWDERLS